MSSRDLRSSASGPLPAANHEALQDLLRRVESATGAGRALDKAIAAVALNVEWRPYRENARKEWAFCRETGKTILYTEDHLNYTASLDAALALVERVKPGWAFTVARCYGAANQPAGPERPYFADVASEAWIETLTDADEHAEAYGATAPLALLAALLKALIAEQAAGSAGERLAAGSHPGSSPQPREDQ